MEALNYLRVDTGIVMASQAKSLPVMPHALLWDSLFVNLPSISNSWAISKNYLGATATTKNCLLQVSVSQAVGKVHDTFVIGAMSQAEGMPQFVNYLLRGSFQKQIFIWSQAIIFLP
jgi:hypothetical protein